MTVRINSNSLSPIAPALLGASLQLRDACIILLFSLNPSTLFLIYALWHFVDVFTFHPATHTASSLFADLCFWTGLGLCFFLLECFLAPRVDAARARLTLALRYYDLLRPKRPYTPSHIKSPRHLAWLERNRPRLVTFPVSTPSERVDLKPLIS